MMLYTGGITPSNVVIMYAAGFKVENMCLSLLDLIMYYF